MYHTDSRQNVKNDVSKLNFVFVLYIVFETQSFISNQLIISLVKCLDELIVLARVKRIFIKLENSD
jgi:hypothetical protein